LTVAALLIAMSPPLSKRGSGKETPKRAPSPAKKKKTKVFKKKPKPKSSGAVGEEPQIDEEDEMAAEEEIDYDCVVSTWRDGSDDATAVSHAARATMALVAALYDKELDAANDMSSIVVGVIGSSAAATRCAEMFGASGATVLETASGKHDADALYPQCEILIVHEHLTQGSAQKLDQACFDKMKEGVTLLAPSPLCNVDALIAALDSKRVGKFGCLSRMAATLHARVVYSRLLASADNLFQRAIDLPTIISIISSAMQSEATSEVLSEVVEVS